MDLGEWVARKIIEGFSQFKPKEIIFEGENLMLIYRTVKSLVRLSPEPLIYGSVKDGYMINPEELVILEKNRKKRLEEELALLNKKINRKSNSKEISFIEYWGEDILIEDKTLYVSYVALNSAKDRIYQRVATTTNGRGLKVIPYSRKGEELTALESIYILVKDHENDKFY